MSTWKAKVLLNNRYIDVKVQAVWRVDAINLIEAQYGRNIVGPVWKDDSEERREREQSERAAREERSRQEQLRKQDAQRERNAMRNSKPSEVAVGVNIQNGESENPGWYAFGNTLEYPPGTKTKSDLLISDIVTGFLRPLLPSSIKAVNKNKNKEIDPKHYALCDEIRKAIDKHYTGMRYKIPSFSLESSEVYLRGECDTKREAREIVLEIYRIDGIAQVNGGIRCRIDDLTNDDEEEYNKKIREIKATKIQKLKLM